MSASLPFSFVQGADLHLHSPIERVGSLEPEVPDRDNRKD